MDDAQITLAPRIESAGVAGGFQKDGDRLFVRGGGGLPLRVRPIDRALVVSVCVVDDLLAQHFHGFDGENPT